MAATDVEEICSPTLSEATATVVGSKPAFGNEMPQQARLELQPRAGLGVLRLHGLRITLTRHPLDVPVGPG